MKPELNGQIGQIVQYFADTGRYAVRLDLKIGDTVTLQNFIQGTSTGFLNGKEAKIVKYINRHYTVSVEHQGNTLRKTIVNMDHIKTPLISVKESNLTGVSEVVPEVKGQAV